MSSVGSDPGSSGAVKACSKGGAAREGITGGDCGAAFECG